ncbi:MAG: hypothetical protein KGY80_08815 [Candidatus Thorarchaeota archaeon]|nr:hypothetical protein [Candidatus Thorarchaeota archaeon]
MTADEDLSKKGKTCFGCSLVVFFFILITALDLLPFFNVQGVDPGEGGHEASALTIGIGIVLFFGLIVILYIAKKSRN